MEKGKRESLKRVNESQFQENRQSQNKKLLKRVFMEVKGPEIQVY